MLGYNWKFKGTTIPTTVADGIANKWMVVDIVWNTTTVENSEVSRQDWHGIISNPTYARSRLITITGVVYSNIATDRATKGTARNAIDSLFQLETFPATANGFYDLEFTDDDGTDKVLKAKVYSKIDYTAEVAENYANFSVNLIAQDPIILGKTLRTGSGGYGIVGGMVLPTTLPVSLNGGVGSFSLTNYGNFASPVVARVTGDILNPKVLNITNNRFFKVNRQLDDMSTLTIDSSAKTAEVNQTNVLGARGDGSVWLYADVGVNHFILLGDDFDPDDTDKATLTVEFYDAWL
jgi:hypothetical protein